jgi:DNA helicase-2/ATP-dependent DNA helicase PcrA
VQARTFHSAALRQLRYFWPRVHGHVLPDLIESKIGLLAGAARRQRVQTDQALLRDLASEVEWAKVSNVSPDDYAGWRTSGGRSVAKLDAESVARIYEGYEEIKRAQTRMDMEDVLLFAAGLLADEEAVAAQVRSSTKWLVVDEFQDVSPLQSALLDLWLGGRDEICVVGDPAQTIYSFAAPTPPISATSRRSTLRPRVSSSSATTARRRRSSAPPTRCWPAAPPRASSSWRSARPARR